MLLGRRQILERPLEAREAITGSKEAFDHIGGRRAPDRAQRRQPLREFGQESSPDGLERAQAPAHGALRGRVKEPLELGRPRQAGLRTGYMLAQAAKGGVQRVEAT